ncbi:hypothetical protein BaRGS_00025791 [Batillaria attramentaria]|uniref:Uncharacterized protein n=1 Tax=Batillaria attramentaria TaxID=370345 RepID=A0ABD0K782_9CAEN
MMKSSPTDQTRYEPRHTCVVPGADEIKRVATWTKPYCFQNEHAFYFDTRRVCLLLRVRSSSVCNEPMTDRGGTVPGKKQLAIFR